MSNVIPSQDLCEDRSLKTTWRRTCLFEERPVVVDLYFPTVQSPHAPFPVNFPEQNFEGGKFKRHFQAITPIPHSKSRRGLVRFQMSHL